MENYHELRNQESNFNGKEDIDKNINSQDESDSEENQDYESSQENNNLSGIERKSIEKGKKRRRTKNDQSGRDFICGCGKTYLSYPALYTHIKEKHNGQIPEGSSKPATNAKGNRGRPRKNDENGSYSKKDLPTLAEILKSERVEDTGFSINPETDFPLVEKFFTSEEIYSPILQQIKLIKEHGKGMEDEPKNGQDLKETICNKILAYYILNNCQDLDKIAFQEICAFTVFYRCALNDLGHGSVKKLFETWEKDYPVKNTNFCDNEYGYYILEVCNDLIEKKLGDYAKTLIKEEYLKDLRIFNDVSGHFRDIINLFLAFADWLKKNSFTNSRLTLN